MKSILDDCIAAQFPQGTTATDMEALLPSAITIITAPAGLPFLHPVRNWVYRSDMAIVTADVHADIQKVEVFLSHKPHEEHVAGETV